MKLFAALGLDVKILIAQFINFGILLFVLYRFAYKPVFKMLNERKEKIEKGVNFAEEAENRLKEIMQKEIEVMKNAKKDAASILEEANLQAEKNKKTIVDKAKLEIAQVIKKEKEQILQEKNQIIKDIKQEISDIVIMTTQKILEDKVDLKLDKVMVEELIKK